MAVATRPFSFPPFERFAEAVDLPRVPEERPVLELVPVDPAFLDRDAEPVLEPDFVDFDAAPVPEADFEDLEEALDALLPVDDAPDFVDLDDVPAAFREVEPAFEPPDDADLDVLDDLPPLLFRADDPFDLLVERDEVAFEVEDDDFDLEFDDF